MVRALIGLVLATSCGGTCPEVARPEAPAPSEATGKAAPSSKLDEDEPAATATEATVPAGDAPAGSGSASNEQVVNPTFPDKASVADAIAAIPKGTERANIDSDTLGLPLQSEALYEPCKVGNQHFKLRVAVWNGRAVGVDISAPNKALADCIDKRVRALEWRDKVRSLNTVDYAM